MATKLHRAAYSYIPIKSQQITISLLQGGPKTDTQFFWDNVGNSAPILTTFSLLQAEIYGA